MTPLVITFVGDDRPGLVNAISERIAASGASWLESRSAQLAGKFAGILRVDVPEANVTDLESSLLALEANGLRVAVERGAASPVEDNARVLALNVLGHERPGIVRDLTQALKGLGVNIEEFSSGIERAAFTGAEMFRAEARLRAPVDLALEDLRKTLERLAGELMVDLAIGESETAP
ncbi:MAG TPA: ACT domain-containing protein [Roseiarcus sp.]|nr:ACT domain-containing protein [Roseiarcus sp.]